MGINDLIDCIFEHVGGATFEPSEVVSRGHAVSAWPKLWILLPLSSLTDLVKVKVHHVMQLVERHLRRPIWTVVATFVRRAIGDVAMQLQVVVGALHVALMTLDAANCDTTGSMIGDDVEHGGQSRKRVGEALEYMVSQLQCASGQGDGVELAARTPVMVELFFNLSDAMQLHASDYLRLLQDSGSLLAQARDDVLSIAARVRLQGPQHGASNQERDDFLQATGQFHAQLQCALQFHTIAEFRSLVDTYGTTTVRPYSCIALRNEGLTQQHMHLLNTCFSPTVVQLLTSYHNTTNLVAQYKQQIDGRNATLRSQASLSQLVIGAQLLQTQNASTRCTVEEMVTLCDGLQTLLKTIQQWTSRGVASTPTPTSTPHDRSDAMAGTDAVSSVPLCKRGSSAEQLFLKLSLNSVDALVQALEEGASSLAQHCVDLEETSQHVLEAVRGLRHDQSTTLFPLGQLAAKMLRESAQLRVMVTQEAPFLHPQRGAEIARLSWVDTVLPSLDASTTDGSTLSVAARRSLMVLASTIATLHDACCLMVPALVIVNETMPLHLDVVQREQQNTAFELVGHHDNLSKMQSQSIRMEEATRDAEHGEATGVESPFTANLKDGISTALRAGAHISSLDVTLVTDLLTAVNAEDQAVAALVHSVVSGLRDTSDSSAKMCFDAVACYCTVVELLSKSIFPSSGGAGGSTASSRSSSIAQRQPQTPNTPSPTTTRFAKV
jgi:hypothetical protein